jgi:hypothetical protein
LGLALAAPLLGARRAHAQLQLRVTFQPDCFRAASAASCDRLKVDGVPLAPRNIADDRLEKFGKDTVLIPDLRPQIAIWLEKADGSFVDSLYVTNATAAYGIGNRPGHWRLPSSIKFPYGKRVMALPVWAHRRGRLYDNLIMQDYMNTGENWLGFHEQVSSTEKFFCRPLTAKETATELRRADRAPVNDVDAVTCPSTMFNSSKGRYVRPTDFRPEDPLRPPQKTYYPPRNDLRVTPQTFSRSDCDEPSQQGNPNCPAAIRNFEQVNDLDVVATATPPYGRAITRSWTVPTELPDGDYVVFLEISKEFDVNAAHSYTASTDQQLIDAGLKNNLGQPSVVYRIPIRISKTAGDQAVAGDITGYSWWDGRDGTLHPADDTISDVPGSGRGRLLTIAVPALAGGAPLVGRVHVSTTSPPVARPDGGTPTPPDGQGGAGGMSINPGAGGAGGTGGGGAPDGRGMLTPPDGPPLVLLPPPPGMCALAGVTVGNLALAAGALTAETADITFTEPEGATHAQIQSYEIRYTMGGATAESFSKFIDVNAPSPKAPGGTLTVGLRGLAEQTLYTVGVRPRAACGDGNVTLTSFTTPVKKFTTLSGCFVATAAYGTQMAAQVNVLRRARDAARARSGIADALVDLYERSSPPLARLLGESDTARAVARGLLSPVVNVLGGADALRPGAR